MQAVQAAISLLLTEDGENQVFLPLIEPDRDGLH